GMISARNKYKLDWRVTRYFKTDGGDLGIGDQALAQVIAQQVRSGALKRGTATTMSGAMLRSQDKADWNYVIYLEDLIDLPPEDLKEQFAGSRKGLDDDARRRYRQVYIDDTVKNAHVQVDGSVKNPGKTSESSGNP